MEGVPKEVGLDFRCYANQLVDFKGLEDVSILGKLVVLFGSDAGETGEDNAFVSLEGLPKELYAKVQGLDVKALKEIELAQTGMLDVVI